MSTRKEMRYSIHKRVDWLEARIKEADAVGRDLAYDKQEASALKWILEREEAYFKHVEPKQTQK